MNIDCYVIAKTVLLIYIWTLITFCILFIFKSKRIYSDLRTYEEHFKKKKREVIHNFVPIMSRIGSQNKSIQAALKINKISKKEILFLLFPFIYNAFMFFQSTKFGIDLTKKLRKICCI